MRYILFFLLLIGCAHPMKPMYFELNNLEIMVVDEHPYGSGYASANINEPIIIEGYIYKGKLLIKDNAALGHEITHRLNQKYPQTVWNPDRIGETP